MELRPQRPSIKGSISVSDIAGKDKSERDLELLVQVEPIRVRGRFSPPPLTKLLMDNPETLLTCRLIHDVDNISKVLGLKGSIKLPKTMLAGSLGRGVDGLAEGPGKAPEGSGELLSDGGFEYQLVLPPLAVPVPAVQVSVGSRTIELKPSLGDNSVVFLELVK